MSKENTSNLYLVEVQPLVRGLREPSMTYFSGEIYPPGSVVSVPFRSRERVAVVLSTKTVAEAKAEIKTIGFALRKIPAQTARQIFSAEFLRMVRDLADYYATSAGEVFASLVPSSILEAENLFALENNSPKERSKKVNKSKSKKTQFIQGVLSSRLDEYTSEIKKNLKKNISTIILAPTIEDVKRITENLRTEFNESVFELSTRVSKKKQVETWNEVLARRAPSVVVLTSAFLSLPLSGVGLYILEKSSSAQFIGMRKPYLDGRIALEKLAKINNAKLVRGDILISLSDIVRSGVDDLSSLDKVAIDVSAKLINMTETAEEKKAREKLLKKKKPFELISDELLVATKTALAENKKVFWFVARRGLFPATVCSDCGNEYDCEKCSSSLVLHSKKNREKKDERFFLCHRCGHKESALVTCKNCNSWRLEPLGIGVERVFVEAQKLFKDSQVLSADATSTKTKIRSALSTFFAADSPGLLVGTDMAISYLEKKADLVGIVSLDSRLAIPLYDAEEFALSTLLSIASLARESVLLQTRRPEHRVFAFLNGKKLDKFRNKEARLRQAFLYPPFSFLVNIEMTKAKVEAESMRNSIVEVLQPMLSATEKLLLPPLRGTKRRGIYTASIVLKLEKSLEENEDLRALIQTFPPEVSIRVEQ